MKKSILNPKVDAFMGRARQWKEEMEKLRMICLDSGLTEEIKWGKPCYSEEGKNIVIIQGFKEYCALLFFKGFLVKDPKGILVKTGGNTHVGRQARYTDLKDIVKQEPALKALIKEAIIAEKSGVKAPAIKSQDLVLVDELKAALAKNPALKKAFYALTPGRQRGYNMHFSQAKQSATRESRIEKYTKQILDGRGLND